ncbi:hypothetical protein F4861DRAFT_549488 [Xylaria intraflava]|nr:hypothetical protein F4861DRAFT_549488 [Xylaria intraflava]
MPAQKTPIFHHFGRLPSELRLKIWVHSWEPKTITIFPSNTGHFILRRTPNKKDINRLPSSAYVNAESRSETLRYYKRCFAQRDKSDFRWFNFRLDTLCVAGDCHLKKLRFLDPNDLKKVQRLIVPESSPVCTKAATPCEDTWPKPSADSFESPGVEHLLRKNYPNLREITLTTSRWYISSIYGTRNHYEFWFIRWHVFQEWGWGYMRNTHIGKLKVRHSPLGPRSYLQRYSCRLSEKDIEALEEELIMRLDT